jgi:hypothetical protein
MVEKKVRKFPSDEERVWQRLKCNLTTDCMAFGTRWPCKIIDLSERGFGLVSSVILHKGDVVELADPSIKARVVWAESTRAGLRAIH